jgi:hypothetical protein
VACLDGAPVRSEASVEEMVPADGCLCLDEGLLVPREHIDAEVAVATAEERGEGTEEYEFDSGMGV